MLLLRLNDHAQMLPLHRRRTQLQESALPQCTHKFPCLCSLSCNESSFTLLWLACSCYEWVMAVEPGNKEPHLSIPWQFTMLCYQAEDFGRRGQGY